MNAHNARALVDARALARYQVGDKVRVLPAYRMGGTFVPDGTEGEYFVVGVIQGAVPDYKLSRVPGGDWDLAVHPSRLELVAVWTCELTMTKSGRPAVDVCLNGDRVGRVSRPGNTFRWSRSVSKIPTATVDHAEGLILSVTEEV